MAESLQQLLVTNFGLSPSGYTGSQGAAGYTGSAGAGAAVPTISAIAYPGNDTAADTAGGQTITLTGTGFAAGATVIVNGNVVPVLSVVNSTTITFTTPAASAGSYIIYVVNTNGTTALAVPGLQYSGTPAWTTAAGSLGTPTTNTSFSANLVATGDAPISYSVYSGSLPSGISLNGNTGVISGTAPTVASNTTYNFTIRATDAQLQDTDRAFSLTVNIAVAAPPSAVEYLVVAGGGGGGGGFPGANYGAGSGAGAGGFRTATGFAISANTAITVTVGAGGAGGSNGSDGTSSSFSTITSLPGVGGRMGGGTAGGGGNGTYASGSGGTGDTGTPNYVGTGGVGTPGQGNSGGDGKGAYAGGGGGAGSAGANGISLSGTGNGGTGIQSSITGTSTYYAGGGAAGGGGATGGLGGGGSSGSGAATINTGGGGGGSSGASYSIGGAGGSGIVILRYADTYSAATSTTGSPTITTTGGYRVYKWTSSGSITF